MFGFLGAASGGGGGSSGGGSGGGGPGNDFPGGGFGGLMLINAVGAGDDYPAHKPRVIYGSYPVSNPELRRRLQIFADSMGRDVRITGGDRTDPDANEQAGGAPNSRHLRALAADLTVPGLSVGRAAIAADEATLPGGRGVLFPTVIFEGNHVHVDLDLRAGQPYRGVRRPVPGAPTIRVPNFRDD